ncbi:MAG: hypothetical protein FJ319_07170 [SAR202 cluster bacterium]|nr:hypothetical protein [SAR202 cluster bacterium]
MQRRFGFGNYLYEYVEGWAKFPGRGVASDIAIDSRGLAYVAYRKAPYPATRTGTILVLDHNGRFVRSFGDNLLATPHGILIGPNDEIYHADAYNHTVTQFNTAGDALMTIGTPGKLGEPGQPFAGPTNIARSRSGDLFVSDGYKQNRVHRFSADGKLKLSWGSGDPVYHEMSMTGKVSSRPGVGPGEFNLPHGIAIDRNDRVYVLDRSNERVQVFDDTGNFLAEWKDIPSPNDVAIDADGNLHMLSDMAVQVMSPDGTVLGRWGETGEGSGQLRRVPHGLWMDRNGDIYIAEVIVENTLHKFARV